MDVRIDAAKDGRSTYHCGGWVQMRKPKRSSVVERSETTQLVLERHPWTRRPAESPGQHFAPNIDHRGGRVPRR